MKIISVIATNNRMELFARTLWSIERAEKPSNYAGLIVVENGSHGALSILESANLSFDWSYYHLSHSNKGKALNLALSILEDGIVYFHDDDIVMDRQALVALGNAYVNSPAGFFFGGPVLVERETANPKWLEDRLPRSATGWRGPSNIISSAKSPMFLGANWAARAMDLKDAGHFPEGLGPNQLGTGLEMYMQQKLLSLGLKGLNVKDAIVWHFVPKERSNMEWLLKRCRKDGYSRGLKNFSDFKSIPPFIYPFRVFYSLILSFFQKNIGSIFRISSLAFAGEIRQQWVQGEISAIKMKLNLINDTNTKDDHV